MDKLKIWPDQICKFSHSLTPPLLSSACFFMLVLVGLKIPSCHGLRV